MITATCIDKVKNKNSITHYILQYEGSLITVSSKQLKLDIANNKINVVNLKLTSNNRLISISENSKENYNICIDRQLIQKIDCNKALSFKSNANIESIEIKCRALGATFKQLRTDTYLIENNDSIIVVSDKQLSLPSRSDSLFLLTTFKSIDLNNLFSGNVTSMKFMLASCSATNINIKNLDTSNVENMSYMFKESRLEEIDISNFDTHNVRNMTGMFYKCKSNKINFGNIDTSRLKKMGCMFACVEIDELNLSNLNTSKVEDMQYTFYELKCNKLNISSLDTHRVTNMESMFFACDTKELDLRNFNTYKVKNMHEMFSYCKADEINLSSFDTSNVNNVLDMFRECKSTVITTDKRIYEELKKGRH